MSLRESLRQLAAESERRRATLTDDERLALDTLAHDFVHKGQTHTASTLSARLEWTVDRAKTVLLALTAQGLITTDRKKPAN